MAAELNAAAAATATREARINTDETEQESVEDNEEMSQMTDAAADVEASDSEDGMNEIEQGTATASIDRLATQSTGLHHHNWVESTVHSGTASLIEQESTKNTASPGDCADRCRVA